MELFLDAPLAQLEMEACRRTVRRLSLLAVAVTVAALGAVTAVVLASGVLS